MEQTLFHGSKSGIKGKIKLCSRAACDFGKGFYMGDMQDQPLTLICSYPGAKLYEIRYVESIVEMGSFLMK